MDRTWIREVPDLGAAIPTIIWIDRFPAEKVVGVSLCARTEPDGEHYYLVVIGERLTSMDVAALTPILEGTGQTSPIPLARLAESAGLAFWATGSASAIVAAVNERMNGHA